VQTSQFSLVYHFCKETLASAWLQVRVFIVKLRKLRLVTWLV